MHPKKKSDKKEIVEQILELLLFSIYSCVLGNIQEKVEFSFDFVPLSIDQNVMTLVLITMVTMMTMAITIWLWLLLARWVVKTNHEKRTEDHGRIAQVDR